MKKKQAWAQLYQAQVSFPVVKTLFLGARAPLGITPVKKQAQLRLCKLGQGTVLIF